MQDELYIRITPELAKKGRGNVGTDPLAGALIVKGGKILSTSFKGDSDRCNYCLAAICNKKESLHNSTIYINIEPGSSDTENLMMEIFNAGISKIVIGCYDTGLTGNEDQVRRSCWGGCCN